MAIDMTAVAVASVISGAVVAAITSTFGSKVRPECRDKLERYAESIHDIEVKIGRSEEYKVALERRMLSMDSKLDLILNRLTK